MRKYFVKPDGSIDGECLVENPVNPYGYKILELDIPDDEFSGDYKVENGKAKLERTKKEKRAKQQEVNTAYADLFAMTPEEVDTFVQQTFDTKGTVALFQMVFSLLLRGRQ